jgi:hypothetical protein
MTTNNQKLNTSAAEFVPVVKTKMPRRGSSASSTASEASTVKSTEKKCYKCNKSGHIAKDHCRRCHELGHKTEDCPAECHGCGEMGHFIGECPKLINGQARDAWVTSTRVHKAEVVQLKQLKKRQNAASKRP